MSGHRVLIKSRPGNRSLLACGTTHEATSFLRNGTPLASQVVHGVSGPLSNCVFGMGMKTDFSSPVATAEFSKNTGSNGLLLVLL